MEPTSASPLWRGEGGGGTSRASPLLGSCATSFLSRWRGSYALIASRPAPLHSTPFGLACRCTSNCPPTARPHCCARSCSRPFMKGRACSATTECAHACVCACCGGTAAALGRGNETIELLQLEAFRCVPASLKNVRDGELHDGREGGETRPPNRHGLGTPPHRQQCTCGMDARGRSNREKRGPSRTEWSEGGRRPSAARVGALPCREKDVTRAPSHL